MTLVYIGCGTDFQPVLSLPEVKDFIYIDCQPQSEFGWDEYETGYFFRKKYLSEFRKLIPKGFCKIENSYPDIYLNSSTNQRIRHYHCLPFPWTEKAFDFFPKEVIEGLKFFLSRGTHLAVCGHHPHRKVLNFLPSNFILVTNEKTFYPQTKEDFENYPSIFNELVETQERIGEIQYLTKKVVRTFKSYEEFLQFK